MENSYENILEEIALYLEKSYKNRPNSKYRTFCEFIKQHEKWINEQCEIVSKKYNKLK